MCSASSSASSCCSSARPRARPARCSTAWPNSPAATGPSRAAPSASPINARLMALSQQLFQPRRPRAGAPHRVRLRGGRQLRGSGQRLAPRRGAVAARERGHHPRRRRRRASASGSAAARRRASRRTAPRPSRPARRPRPTRRSDRRPACRRSSGHLRSVVGLVWRSVVLWMLLLALLSLANLIG